MKKEKLKFTVIENIKEFPLKGYININYYPLVRVFDKPFSSNQIGSEGYWEIHFEDGTISTIYDLINDDSPDRDQDLYQLDKVNYWCVGGNNKKSLNYIKTLFPEYTIEKIS